MATRKKVAGKATTRSTKNNLTATERRQYTKLRKKMGELPPKKKAPAKKKPTRGGGGALALGTPRYGKKG